MATIFWGLETLLTQLTRDAPWQHLITLMAFDQCLHEEATAMLVSSQAHEIVCGNGHILSGPIYPYGLAFDAPL